MAGAAPQLQLWGNSSLDSSVTPPLAVPDANHLNTSSSRPVIGAADGTAIGAGAISSAGVAGAAGAIGNADVEDASDSEVEPEDRGGTATRNGDRTDAVLACRPASTPIAGGSISAPAKSAPASVDSTAGSRSHSVARPDALVAAGSDKLGGAATQQFQQMQAASALVMQQQQMFMQQYAMMAAMAQGQDMSSLTDAMMPPGAAWPGCPTKPPDRKTLRKAAEYQKLSKKGDNKTVVFVGGLRKSTDEDQVTAHFAKFGQVKHVEIKRQPNGTSRGFAFVKFNDEEAVERVLENRASHMIDNKWVDVKRHDGVAACAGRAASLQKDAEETQDGWEDNWSSQYLTIASQLGSGQESASDTGASEGTMMQFPCGSDATMFPGVAMDPTMMGYGACGGGMMGFGIPIMGPGAGMATPGYGAVPNGPTSSKRSDPY